MKNKFEFFIEESSVINDHIESRVMWKTVLISIFIIGIVTAIITGYRQITPVFCTSLLLLAFACFVSAYRERKAEFGTWKKIYIFFGTLLLIAVICNIIL